MINKMPRDSENDAGNGTGNVRNRGSMENTINGKNMENTENMANSNKLEIGNSYNMDLIDMTVSGSAVGRMEGTVVFVSGGIVGDKVKVELDTIKKKFATGHVVEILEPSIHRVKSKCEVSDACGGCDFLAMNYTKQLEVKKKMVQDAFQRIGKIESMEVKDILAMEDPWNYRNKGVFQAGVSKNGEFLLGFFGRGSNQSSNIVDGSNCLVQHKAALAAVRAVKAYFGENGKLCFKRMKALTAVEVKTGFSTDEVMVVFHVDVDHRGWISGFTGMEELVERMDDEIAQAGFQFESFVVRDKKKGQVVAGRDFVKDRIGNMDIEMGWGGFNQVNPKMTEKLYDMVAELMETGDTEDIKEGARVLDLYCGSGGIGLYIASKCDTVIGIESNRDGILRANRNATINGIVNARFVAGKVEEILPNAGKEGFDFDSEIVENIRDCDTVILDPPRAGCRRELLDSLIDSKATKIIYVSCNPATQARDIGVLVDGGFRAIKAMPVDMFPHTGHVETVALLSKKCR